MKKIIIALVVMVTMVVCNEMVAMAISVRYSTWDGQEYHGEGTSEIDENGDPTIDIDGADKDVTATFTKESGTVTDVTIAWGNLKYKYNGTLKWENGQYVVKDANQKEWLVDDADTGVDGMTNDQIKVINDSNVTCEATMRYVPNTNYVSNITNSFEYDGDAHVGSTANGYIYTLESKANVVDANYEVLVNLKLQGAPIFTTQITNHDLQYGTTLGTVTVSLEAIQ